MKKRIYEDLVGPMLIGLFCWMLIACNPQKRLNRLISNNPELAQTDTVYTTKVETLPGFHLDTNFRASENVAGLVEIIDTYRDYLDSVNRQRLYQGVKNYIIDRPCLEDTFFIQLENKGYCKVWQAGSQFHYRLHQPARKVSFTVPVQVKQIQVTESHNWKMFWIGLAVVPALCLILFVLLKSLKA